MLRPAFAACLGAAFGALTIGAARERFADMLVQPAEAYSVAFVSAAAFLLAVLVLACGEPADRRAASRCCLQLRDTAAGIRPARVSRTKPKAS